MARRNAPKVNTSCVADKYAGTGEKIIEFSGTTHDQGGLISFRFSDDGKLHVNVYRQGKDVEITIGKPEGS